MGFFSRRSKTKKLIKLISGEDERMSGTSDEMWKEKSLVSIDIIEISSSIEMQELIKG